MNRVFSSIENGGRFALALTPVEFGMLATVLFIGAKLVMPVVGMVGAALLAVSFLFVRRLHHGRREYLMLIARRWVAPRDTRLLDRDAKWRPFAPR